MIMMRTLNRIQCHINAIKKKINEKRSIDSFVRNAKDWKINKVVNGSNVLNTLIFSEKNAIELELILAFLAEYGGCYCYLVGSRIARDYWLKLGFSRSRFIAWETYLNKFEQCADTETKKIFSKSSDLRSVLLYEYDGINIGKHVVSILERNLMRAVFDPLESEHITKLQELFMRTIQKTMAIQSLYNDYNIKQLIINEPNYDNIGISRSIVKAGGCYIQPGRAYEDAAFIFKRFNSELDSTHPVSLSKNSSELVKSVASQIIQKEVSDVVQAKYSSLSMCSRRNGLNTPTISRDSLLKVLNLDRLKKTVVIFSHVLWDANRFYGQDLFSGGAQEWLIETVRIAIRNKKANWIIKVHPANVWKINQTKSEHRYNELEILEKVFGTLPEHIQILLPEQKINPLSLFQIVDVGITIRGTVGVELPMFGIPVIAAGTGRYTGHGFTIEPESIDKYKELLLDIHNFKKLNDDTQWLARKYFWGISKPRVWRSNLYSTKVLHNEAAELSYSLKPWSSKGPSDDAMITFLSDTACEDYFYYNSE